MYSLPILCTRLRRSGRCQRYRSFLPRLAQDVGPPYNEESAVCIGCGACAFICPTGHIEMETTEDKRIIWGRTFKMKTCDVCGRYFAPEDQLKYISKITGVPLKELAVCMDCR